METKRETLERRVAACDAEVRWVREHLAEWSRMMLKAMGKADEARADLKREFPDAGNPKCPLCSAHYGDAGVCDEGKPVASPHRTEIRRLRRDGV